MTRLLPYAKVEVNMGINLELKAELIRPFGTRIEAAKTMGITENRLSHIVRARAQLSERERKLSDKATRWNGRNLFPWREAAI